MYSDREESVLRTTLVMGLRGHRAAPSDRRRVVLVSLAAMQSRCRAAALVARERAAEARRLAERLERAADEHDEDAAKIRDLARRVRSEGLPASLERYCPPGWMDLAG